MISETETTMDNNRDFNGDHASFDPANQISVQRREMTYQIANCHNEQRLCSSDYLLTRFWVLELKFLPSFRIKYALFQISCIIRLLNDVGDAWGILITHFIHLKIPLEF
jgi:hypothetical protein